MKRVYIYNMCRVVCRWAACLSLVACADHWDDFTPVHDEASEATTTQDDSRQAIAFAATVSPSLDTRADGSLINRLETSLFKTADRSYWAWNSETGQVEETKRQYSVGLFGYYHGSGSWTTTSPANFMFNQKMDIEAAVSDTTQLSYHRDETATYADSLVRFWPNQHDGGNYEKVSFWAYYPWNATGDPGENGISIVSTATTVGEQTYGITATGGMGSVRFTMHPDASEQSDFMISDLVPNCSKDQYPLLSTGTPKPVPLKFHHMLAQVRMYAFIRGTDKVVYAKKGTKTLTVKSAYDAEAKTLTLTDGTTDYECTNVATNQYVDAWGVTKTLAVGDSVPDDWPFLTGDVAVVSPKTVRWQRGTTLDVTGKRYRTTATYTMSFNNIHTSCVFTPTYDAATEKTTFTYQDVGTLGSATINHYIMNPYWFRWNKDGERVMLNENYMYDYFEGTDAAKGANSTYDGQDWSTFSQNTATFTNTTDGQTYNNPMSYLVNEENADPDDARGHAGWHFNYAPGNIILAVPQVMSDNDVPNVVLEGTGKQVTYEWNGSAYKAKVKTDSEGDVPVVGKVTINMLNMNLKWESGFIYSYAFLEDDLKPGDDKVKGPESITTVFDPTKWTDQW